MRVTLVCPNLYHDAIRLQPGRYVTEVVKYLQNNGHAVTIVTDTGSKAIVSVQVNGANVETIKTVLVTIGYQNDELKNKVVNSSPDILVWLIGQSSFWHLSWPNWIAWPVVGLFAGSIYTPQEIVRLGFDELRQNPQFYGYFLLSALVPRWLVQRVLNHQVVHSVIVLSKTVQQQLQQQGIPQEKIKVIYPGLDPLQQDELPVSTTNDNKELTALYLGSPYLYRGADAAIKAIAHIGQRWGHHVKLIILSRRHDNQMIADENKLLTLIEHLQLQNQVKVMSGFLSPTEVQQQLYQTDMILLPFKLIPSEMPLAIMEGMRQGKPVITSALGSTVEVLAHGRGLTVTPNSPTELAQAMMSLVYAPAMRQTMGQKAQKYIIESWPTWPEMGQQVEMVLHEATHKPTILTSPRLICLIGPDGVGKSTFIKEIMASVTARGGKAKQVWLRFPQFLSVPLLVYCRLTGLSYHFQRNNVKYGVWEMWRSRWVSKLFPWLQLIDMTLYLIFKIYLPLWFGWTVVCDRFVHDTLVDIMVGIDNDQLHTQWVGQLFLKLVPAYARVVCIDSSSEVTFKRRPELKYDTPWKTRQALYQQICMRENIPIIDNSQSIEATREKLVQLGEMNYV